MPPAKTQGSQRIVQSAMKASIDEAIAGGCRNVRELGKTLNIHPSTAWRWLQRLGYERLEGWKPQKGQRKAKAKEAA